MIGMLDMASETSNFIDIIIECIFFVFYSILLNGLYGRINPTKGPRQGDLLSPYLFILAMTVFLQVLLKVEKNGKIHGA